VLALDHVDLGYLLPRARLLVHHGGIGTLAQALRAGIPQIIRPRMYDQPMNGLRVALNGLGGMLYDDGYNGAEIANVYRHISTSELHRERIAHYGALTRAQDGAASAAALISTCPAVPGIAVGDDAPAPALRRGMSV
jgi:rhamnosyltransferase subunit B